MEANHEYPPWAREKRTDINTDSTPTTSSPHVESTSDSTKTLLDFDPNFPLHNGKLVPPDLWLLQKRNDQLEKLRLREVSRKSDIERYRMLNRIYHKGLTNVLDDYKVRRLKSMSHSMEILEDYDSRSNTHEEVFADFRRYQIANRIYRQRIDQHRDNDSDYSLQHSQHSRPDLAMRSILEGQIESLRLREEHLKADIEKNYTLTRFTQKLNADLEKSRRIRQSYQEMINRSSYDRFSRSLPESGKLPELEPQNTCPDGRGVRIFEIPCQVGDHSTNALGDYAAKRNFINEKYALSLGLPVDRENICKVTIGSGKQVVTAGTATVRFRFSEESSVHNVIFHLLPNCIHNVILGKQFLKLTKTFSKTENFCRRVKERLVRGISQFHLLYLGDSAPMFEGSVNGRVQSALADSGSKVLIMDEAYARSIGAHIQTGLDHQTSLRFADGSIADTAGMAYNVEWRFGHDHQGVSYELDFHILKNAPANVILSDTFLFDTQAFSEYHHYLIDSDDDYDDGDKRVFLFAIDFDKRRKQTKVNVTSYSLSDLQYLELVHRGEQADRISALPGPERVIAQATEDERCAQVDQAFVDVRTGNQPQSLQLLADSILSQMQLNLSSAVPTETRILGSNQTVKKMFLRLSIGWKRGAKITSPC
ncbi:hypothetical protein HAV15_009158 [Penicillium sp. str. |nr:hypothetical protein HAV15_009158 [Penicillium sp. str. \